MSTHFTTFKIGFCAEEAEATARGVEYSVESSKESDVRDKMVNEDESHIKGAVTTRKNQL